MMKAKKHEEIKEYCKALKLAGIGKYFEEEQEEAEDFEDYLHTSLKMYPMPSNNVPA